MKALIAIMTTLPLLALAPAANASGGTDGRWGGVTQTPRSWIVVPSPRGFGPLHNPRGWGPLQDPKGLSKATNLELSPLLKPLAIGRF